MSSILKYVQCLNIVYKILIDSVWTILTLAIFVLYRKYNQVKLMYTIQHYRDSFCMKSWGFCN